MFTDLEFRHFVILRIKDNDGEVHKFKIFDDICNEWRRIAALLDLRQLICEFEVKHAQSIRPYYYCCFDIVNEWFNRGSDRYPPTWEGFLKLLYDLELCPTLRIVIKEGTIID